LGISLSRKYNVWIIFVKEGQDGITISNFHTVGIVKYFLSYSTFEPVITIGRNKSTVITRVIGFVSKGVCKDFYRRRHTGPWTTIGLRSFTMYRTFIYCSCGIFGTSYKGIVAGYHPDCKVIRSTTTTV